MDDGVNIWWSKSSANGLHDKQVQFAAFMFLFTWVYTTHPAPIY